MEKMMKDPDQRKTDMNSKKNRRSGNEWAALGERIWEQSRRELFMSMRYMFSAINRMQTRADGSIKFTATDGEYIYYNPMLFVQRYKESPVFINRAYLHMVMHCLFLSIWKADGSDEEERRRWDIASDIYAEYVIDGMESEAVLQPEIYTKEKIYKELINKCKFLSPDNIYRELINEDENALQEMERIFTVDDHRYWSAQEYEEKPSEESGDQERNSDEENEKTWQNEASRTITAISAFGAGNERSRLSKGLKHISQKKMRYPEFLSKFMRLQEEKQTDMDSFDYGYYCFGLAKYGNMPILEELETKEERKLGDLIIVVDTSGSCAGERVEKFMKKTFEYISNDKMFFKRARIRLILADNEIQADYRLRAGEDIDKIREKIRLKGYGGTDYRPAFRYVRLLLNKHEAEKISGMIYFTDGYGIYPKERPPWKTAFIFDREPDFEEERRLNEIRQDINGTGVLYPPGWTLTNIFTD